MREIAIVFICFAGVLVIGSWALIITLAIKSGKGLLSLFARQHKIQWLSVADSIAQYGSDHTDMTD
jgi:hypothetical protein